MLIYASVEDFMQMQDINKTNLVASGIISANAFDDGKDKIRTYLERATRFIDRITRRRFFPYVKTNQYPIPYAINDLAIRRYPDAHLKLFEDLLEPITVNNGQENIPNDGFFMLEQNFYPKHILVVKYPYYWGGSYGGTSAYSRYDQSTITVNGIWGYGDVGYPREFWIDTFEVIETGGITSSQTVLSVSDADGIDDWGRTRFVIGKVIRVENELMEVMSVNTADNEVTVKRGINGSTAVAHAEDVAITSWRVIEDIVEACLTIAKIWRESDIAAGGRLGVSDYSAGVEVEVPADTLKILRSYNRSMIM